MATKGALTDSHLATKIAASAHDVVIHALVNADGYIPQTLIRQAAQEVADFAQAKVAELLASVAEAGARP